MSRGRHACSTQCSNRRRNRQPANYFRSLSCCKCLNNTILRCHHTRRGLTGFSLPSLECLRSRKNALMSRLSNRGRGGSHSNRANYASELHQQTRPAQANVYHGGASHNTPPMLSGIAGDPMMGVGAASAEDRDSQREAAPLGVGGVPGKVDAPPNRKRTAGDLVAIRADGSPLHLTADKGRRKLRGTGDLSPSEAREIARCARSHGLTAGVRVVRWHAGSTLHPVPAARSDRQQAVLRWSRRVIGRPVSWTTIATGLAQVGALEPLRRWCRQQNRAADKKK